MADNFGSKQSRVLNVKDRSLDNTVFLYRTPPLTSEWNLINQIGNEKVRNISEMSYPSGWLRVGEILQDKSESLAVGGQVYCSESYEANSMKLMSAGDTMALVNGWPLIITGINSSDSNNIIRLSEPAGQIYDFVFLEVWRKLVSSSDPIYPYGNTHLNPYSDNEIEWDAIGTETSQRVQIQFRVRDLTISTVLSATSDVFSDVSIGAIGGRTSGASSVYTFSKYGSKDIGLFVAGNGSSDAKTALNTVDGYVYAVPMFLVYRRVKSDSLFSPSQMKRSFIDKQDADGGYRSDRPDSKIADVIYADEIMDYRHKVLTSGKDLDQVVGRSFSKLIAGDLSTALKRGAAEDGALTDSFTGSRVLMKLERINSVGGDDIPDVGDGSNTTSTTFKRRAFCNAEITHDHNVVEVPHSGAWSAGTITISSFLSLPDGEIVSVDGFYVPDDTDIASLPGTSPIPTGITPSTTTITIADSGNNSIVESSVKLMMEFTFKYYSSTQGFKDVPREFLEVNKGTQLPIATRDRDIPLRFNNDGVLMDFGASPGDPSYPGDTNQNDFVRYRGGNYTEGYNFGHEMVIYRTSNGSSQVTISLNNSKLNGYYILGVKSVEVEGSPSGTYQDPEDFNQTRTITTSPYAITSYTIWWPTAPYPNKNMRITLYTGSKFIQDAGDTYSLSESFKFFELSKQGRGVTDTYEMMEAIAEEDGVTGNYTIDTNDKPIIAFITKAYKSAGHIESEPFAFKFGTSAESVGVEPIEPPNAPPLNAPPLNAPPLNVSFPVLTGMTESGYAASTLPTKAVIQATAGLTKLRVPVLVHSYVAQSESPYNFYYKTVPYQGLLGSGTEMYGEVRKQAPALVTTLGSGAIKNWTYDAGNATFSASLHIVSGVAASGVTPEWSTYVKAGDFIRVSGGSYLYRILTVDSDTQLTLAERYKGGNSTTSYEIIRLDVPNAGISNVLERLPALKITSASDADITAYKCYSDEILGSYGGGSVSTEPGQILIDPLNALVNDFKVGSNATAKRGRNNFLLTDTENPAFKYQNPRPYIYYDVDITLPSGHYKKVYQAYLFNRSAKEFVTGEVDLTGRLYLMVVSGETAGSTAFLNGSSNRDTVDIFELEGRPIIKHG